MSHPRGGRRTEFHARMLARRAMDAKAHHTHIPTLTREHTGRPMLVKATVTHPDTPRDRHPPTHTHTHTHTHTSLIDTKLYYKLKKKLKLPRDEISIVPNTRRDDNYETG